MTKKSKPKNKAAQALARKRWKKATKKERSAVGAMLKESRLKKLVDNVRTME